MYRLSIINIYCNQIWTLFIATENSTFNRVSNFCLVLCLDHLVLDYMVQQTLSVLACHSMTQNLLWMTIGFTTEPGGIVEIIHSALVMFVLQFVKH